MKKKPHYSLEQMVIGVIAEVGFVLLCIIGFFVVTWIWTR